MRYLEEQTPVMQPPPQSSIVPCRDSLRSEVVTGRSARMRAGYKACQTAKAARSKKEAWSGAGATVGKLNGGKPMKGGIGRASIRLPNGLVMEPSSR